jgi:hypothetical protein
LLPFQGSASAGDVPREIKSYLSRGGATMRTTIPVG